MTDYKQLCAGLVDTLELCDWPYMLKEVIRAEIVRARAALAEPEPEGQPPAEPVAWMYRGEPDFDGTAWRENWEVTTSHQLAVFKAQPNQPVPLVPAAANQ